LEVTARFKVEDLPTNYMSSQKLDYLVDAVAPESPTDSAPRADCEVIEERISVSLKVASISPQFSFHLEANF
jgi:hypothetical protein